MTNIYIDRMTFRTLAKHMVRFTGNIRIYCDFIVQFKKLYASDRLKPLPKQLLWLG